MNKQPQRLTEVEMASVNCRADAFQRFDECVFKLRHDCQRLPTKHGPKAQPVACRWISSNAFPCEEKRLSLRSVWTTEKTTRTRKERGTRASGSVLLALFETSYQQDTFGFAQQQDATFSLHEMTLLSSQVNMPLSESVCVTTMSSALPGCCPLIQIIRASL